MPWGPKWRRFPDEQRLVPGEPVLRSARKRFTLKWEAFFLFWIRVFEFKKTFRKLPLRKGMRLKFPQLIDPNGRVRRRRRRDFCFLFSFLFFFLSQGRKKKEKKKESVFLNNQSEQARLRFRGGYLPPLIMHSEFCEIALCGEADLAVFSVRTRVSFYDAEVNR